MWSQLGSNFHDCTANITLCWPFIECCFELRYQSLGGASFTHRIRRFHSYATDGLSVTGDGGGGSGSCINPISLLGEGGGSPSSEKCNLSEK